jgi:predicted nuclease with RNAse H fold
MNNQIVAAFVGIDVAFAKKKRLPISVCIKQNHRLVPLELRELINCLPPPGKGNKAALEQKIVEQYCQVVIDYLKQVEELKKVKIRRIAIDAPSTYKIEGVQRRNAEIEMDKRRISCFATPSEKEFEAIRAKCREHFDNGGEESRLPHANQIWMLVGFALFQTLRKEFECIEVFPQAIVHALGCSGVHKLKSDGFFTQVDAIAKKTGWNLPKLLQKLKKMGYGSRHDKLDAFLSAWVASLTPEDRIACGQVPDDVIWIPRI